MPAEILKSENVEEMDLYCRAAKRDARLTRLQSLVKHMALGDALDVWDQAGIRERESLADIIFPKVVTWRKRSGMDESEREEMQRRIVRMNNQARLDKESSQDRNSSALLRRTIN
jgi:hypothetical protein